MRVKPILKDRRFMVSIIAIVALFILGWKGTNVGDSIALIAIALSGANAASEAARSFARAPKKKTKEVEK